MRLERRTYEIQLVTPTFLAGADQQSPELRVPSIRGCLRWWFRLAQHGAGISPSDIRKAEAELFGSTDAGFGQRLILRLHASQRGTAEPNYRGLPFDHQYLWFPLRPEKGSDRRVARPALAPGTIFRLEAIVPPATLNGTDVLRQLDVAVSQWVVFGSLGMRGRRCAGSLWFSSRLPSGEELPLGAEAIRRILDHHRASLPIEIVLSSETFPSWEGAVRAAGNHYRGQRQEVKARRGRGALPALGWPIMKFPALQDGRIEVDGHESERLASPVMLKVVPDGSNFRWLLVVVKKSFVAQIRSGQGTVRPDEVVRDFVQGFEQATAPQPGSGPRPQR